ncbi:hypothetical protein [Thermanaeromonas toyohensis]|uniref:hypothetical protein n=1 Tax=Thermanaeromonas toyohensis TaxID=161154 RepID=UPI00155FF7B9|nr:hypothetical protein [Thermanaeromonas toyohensis]
MPQRYLSRILTRIHVKIPLALGCPVLRPGWCTVRGGPEAGCTVGCRDRMHQSLQFDRLRMVNRYTAVFPVLEVCRCGDCFAGTARIRERDNPEGSVLRRMFSACRFGSAGRGEPRCRVRCTG